MRIIVTSALLLLAMPVLADESALYESVDDLAIGPVFLTPGERRWLDANRHLPPQNVSAQSTESAEAEGEEEERAEPAGFIINSSGQTRRYRDGDFSPSNASPESMRFPDDVEIRRHVTERPTEAQRADEDGPDDETVDD